jgi:hypothetical protein
VAVELCFPTGDHMFFGLLDELKVGVVSFHDEGLTVEKVLVLRDCEVARVGLELDSRPVLGGLGELSGGKREGLIDEFFVGLRRILWVRCKLVKSCADSVDRGVGTENPLEVIVRKISAGGVD